MINKTFNPAGQPTVIPLRGPKPYTREDFVRDIKTCRECGVYEGHVDDCSVGKQQ